MRDRYLANTQKVEGLQCSRMLAMDGASIYSGILDKSSLFLSSWKYWRSSSVRMSKKSSFLRVQQMVISLQTAFLQLYFLAGNYCRVAKNILHRNLLAISNLNGFNDLFKTSFKADSMVIEDINPPIVDYIHFFPAWCHQKGFLC